MKRRVVIAGGNGFLGRMLRRHFAACDADVVILTREAVNDASGGHFVQWDGHSIGPWQKELEGAEALINLAGRSVDCRYNAANRREIMASRLNSTRALGTAVAACDRPPKVWLNASTATIYRHSLDREMSESDGEIAATAEVKDAFSIEVARAWEEAFQQSETPGTRKVAMRAAMVLGTDVGGVYRVLRRLTRAGLGGRMGDGRQFVSWMHESDFCRAVDWLIARDAFAGAVNLCAPEPVPSVRMMAALREVSGMPIGLPVTRWMLELGAFVMRTETELILKSRRVVPQRLLNAGFEFRFPQFEAAIAELESRLSGEQAG